MPDRVVALQLLSSYWLAVILPPLPGILCFSAIYNNERISALSALSPYFHQGRKFGGYKILPKSCKDTISAEKEGSGVCMFNYECTQRAGTVVGSCMDGFLYGTCCKLPTGVSISTMDAPASTSSKPATSASERSTTIVKPHIEHAPEETFLLFKNGTIVQNVYSPDDFLMFTKQQTPLYMHTSPLPDTEILDTKVQETDATEATKRATTTFLQKMTTFPSYNADLEPSSNNLNPSHLYDLAISFAKVPTSTATPTSKQHYTTANSREPFSPNFSSSKYNTPVAYTTKGSAFTSPKATSFHTASTRFSTYQTSPNIYTPITNKIDIYDEEENLIRVPTLTADSVHKYGSNNSINHILWLLNDTKYNTEAETDMSTPPTQSFYTWLSVQNNPEKGSTSYYTTKPIYSSYFDPKPSTPLPGTTVHHIPGPSFHVTPEVKITPKPPNNAADSAPTVIVLTSAQDASTKKPLHSFSTTTASYNVSYHFPHGGTTSTKLQVKPSYAPKPSTYSDKPTYSLLITGKPQQPNYSGVRPLTSNYVSKPISSNLGTTPKPSTVYTTSPLLSSYRPVKTPSAVHTQRPSHNEIPSSSTLPSILQTTIVTTAKPVFNSNGNVAESTLKPLYSTSPVPSFSNAGPLLSTTSYVTIKPPSTNLYGITPVQALYGDNPAYPGYPGSNVFFNSTEDLIAFPPVRDPHVNLTASQQEKPILTATTVFGGDEETESEVTPQFVVDKTLEDKMHVFVEKIVQSLQGNFEDLEKVLITGESTNNVTVSNSNVTPKPASGSKKPTKKPAGGAAKPTTVRPGKPAITTLPVSSTVITKKPQKKPSLATPVLLFQPSTSQSTIALPTKKPIKITTTVSISPVSSTESSSAVEEIFSSSTPENVETEDDDYVDFRKTCGIRPLAKKNGRIVGGKGSNFGGWPWQVLVREATWLGLFTKNKCGGVLITNKYVITAAHCQPGFLANLVAVFGEYDISGEVESKRSVSKNVRRVIVHRQYDAATFENDIALLELESPVQFDSHIVPICMPEDEEDFTSRIATVTGWGRLKYGGGVPTVLQEVQVPVMENRVCQDMFQTAGHSKVILNSFICAGYANGQRDSCEGDSGGPLMVERSDGHWVLVATVSHGIKCAAPYLPGVYMRTTYYKPWLQTITGV